MHSNLSLNTNYLRLCLQLASFWSTGKLQLVVQTHIRHPKFSQTTTPPVVVSTNCHEGTSIWSCLLCGPSLWLRFGHILRRQKYRRKLMLFKYHNRHLAFLDSWPTMKELRQLRRYLTISDIVLPSHLLFSSRRELCQISSKAIGKRMGRRAAKNKRASHSCIAQLILVRCQLQGTLAVSLPLPLRQAYC